MKLSSLEGIFSYILLRDMFNLQVHHDHTHSRFRKRSRHAWGLKNGKKKVIQFELSIGKESCEKYIKLKSNIQAHQFPSVQA
jgi:hypothetical protein